MGRGATPPWSSTWLLRPQTPFSQRTSRVNAAQRTPKCPPNQQPKRHDSPRTAWNQDSYKPPDRRRDFASFADEFWRRLLFSVRQDRTCKPQN